jgi:hypothetical protein
MKKKKLMGFGSFEMMENLIEKWDKTLAISNEDNQRKQKKKKDRQKLTISFYTLKKLK